MAVMFSLMSICLTLFYCFAFSLTSDMPIDYVFEDKELSVV